MEEDRTTPDGSLDRRSFLSAAIGAVAGACLCAKSAEAAEPAAKAADPTAKKRKWGMVIDLDKCTGCQACTVACRAENNVPIAGPGETEKDRAIFWMDMMTVREGELPDLKVQFMPVPCNHCENPPCIKVCPVKATHISEEGIVAQIFARCIGCRYCTTACPYTRRYFNWYEPAWPEEMKKTLNPDVSVRPKGVVEKCTFCHQRIRAVKEKARAEGREINDNDVRRLPACSASCPADAISFGDLNDPESEVSKLERSPRAMRLQEELGTRPKVIYLREAKWRE